MPTQYTQICEHCGNEFVTLATYVRAGRSRFCSRPCARSGPPVAQRFWAHVIKTPTCWLWGASLKPNGYGQFSIKRKQRLSHRVAWELTHGPIPDGIMVCHSCDNPRCVNPDHLFLGTHSANMIDRAAKGRANLPRGQKHGLSLHPERRVRGEHVPGAKLNDEKVRDIRHLAAEGMTHQAIANRFGVTQSVVSRIVKRLGWKHVA